MGRIWGNWGVGLTAGALAASLPAFADTYDVPTGQTQVQSSQVIDGTSANSVTVSGGGTLVLSNAANSYSGGTTVAGGSTLQVSVDGDLGAASGAVTLGDSATTPTSGTLDLSTSTAAVTSARAITINTGGGTLVTGANAWTLSGAITGAGELTITGGGTVVLSGTNTYSGGTLIEDGSTLKVSVPGNLGTGSIIFGDTAGTTSGTLDLTGTTAATTSGQSITINGGGGTIVTGPDTWTMSGVISGAGHLTVDGTGMLSLTGTNTYTGGTTISGGATVEIGADAQLGATSGGVTLGGATSTGTLQLTSSAAVTSALNLTLASGGGIIDVTDKDWTISNAIAGPGGLTLTGPGALILEGANTYTGATTINAGSLELGTAAGTGAAIAGTVTVASGASLSGFGTIAGSLTNSGMVEPGHTGTVGTLTVGSFSQSSSGTLAIEVTPTAASELKVTGAADLAGSLKLLTSGQLKAGSYDIVNAGTLSGTFATVSGTLSAALGEQIIYTPTDVELVLTQLTTLPERPTIYAAIKSTEIDGAQTANSTILSHLTGIRTGAAVDQMPMSRTWDHVPGSSIGASPYGAWAQGQGGFGSTSGSGSAPGYDAHGGGFMAGIDAQLGRGGVLGFAVGYDITSVGENDGGASGTIDTPRFAIYGGYWLGPVAVDASVGFGAPSITSNRPVTQTNTTASASYVGSEYTAGLQASSPVTFGSFVVTPAIGAQYARLRLHNFSEDGAAGYDLDGPQNTTNSLRPFVSATASTRFFYDTRTVLEPTLRVAYSTEAMSNSRQVTVIPEGDDATFEFEGVKPSRGEGSIDAGLTVETSHDLGFFTDAAVVGLGNTSGVKLDAGMRYRF